MINKYQIKIKVNGENYTEEVEPRLLASDFIRDQLRLTGTHVGCEHGVCGACTIIVNGKTIRSCLKFAIQLDDTEVETVENFGSIEQLNDIQEAASQDSPSSISYRAQKVLVYERNCC